MATDTDNPPPKKRRKSPSKKPKSKDKRDLDVLSAGRLAMESLRQLVGYNYELLGELKELIRSLDDGKRLDISGIPDAYVKEQVAIVFKNCSLLRRTDKYTYQTRDRAGRGTVMALLGPVLAEPREELEAAYAAAKKGACGSRENTRTLGPSLPTAEERAAATAAVAVAADDPDDSADAVGPSLPEFVFEDMEASSDPKVAAVGRVMGVLEAHRARDLRGEDAKAFAPNPYVVLGLIGSEATAVSGHVDVPEVTDGQVKKTFMKLSLLLHPDKNEHPCAASAFEAVSTAAKRLQDAAGRVVVGRELAEMWRVEAMRGVAEREARRLAWASARGEAVDGEQGRGSGRGGPAVREEWMTMLPERGDPLANLDIGVSRSFSTKPSVGPMHAGPAATAGHAHAPSAPRGPSLMEQHAARMKGGAGAGDAATTVGARRPFDRDLDLDLKRPGTGANPAELLKGMKVGTEPTWSSVAAPRRSHALNH